MAKPSVLPETLQSPQVIQAWLNAGLPEIPAWANELMLSEYPGTLITKNMLVRQITNALAPVSMTIQQFRAYCRQHETISNEDPILQTIFQDAETPRLPTVDEVMDYNTLVELVIQRQEQHLIDQADRAAEYAPEPLPRDGNQVRPHGEFDPQERIERILKAVEDLDDLMQEVDPVITHKEYTFREGPIAILGAGCMQLGGRWTFHSMIREKLAQALSHPRTRIIFLGDEIEGFQPWFFSAKSVVEQPITPKVQSILFEAFFRQVQSHVLAGTWSQHGSVWFENRAGINPLKDYYRQANIAYFDGKALLTCHVGDQTYHIAVSHEFPGNSMWNPNHAHIRAARFDFPSADVIMMADKHQYAHQERQIYQFEAEAGLRASPWVHLVQVGTAKTGADPYSIRGWSRGQGEWPWIVLWPDEHKVKVTRHFDDVLDWLGG